ncbi:hypothetical protein FQZ97_698250 [compost metagenome]
MHVDIAFVEQRRLNSEINRTRTNIRCRRRDRFLHHVAEVTRDGHATLTRHHDTFNGQQLAANFSPGETCDNADLIFTIDLTVTEALDAEIIGEILISDFHRLLLRLQNLGHGLTGQSHHFTFKATHTGFTCVKADNIAQRIVRDRKLLRLQSMILDRLWQQVPLGNLELFIFGVTGNTDDFHTVQKWTRNVQRIGSRHEHDVRQIIFNLKVMIHEG